MPSGANGVTAKKQAARLQRLLFRLLRFPKDHALADVELSQREVRLLIALGEEALGMTELAARLDAPVSTVTRRVDRLVEKGLVERARPENSRRSVVVRTTPRGLALYSSCEQHHLEMARAMLSPLTPAERGMLLELMEKMTSGLASPAQTRRE